MIREIVSFCYNFGGFNQKLFLLINQTTNISILPSILQFISWPFGISNFTIYYFICCGWGYLKLIKIKEANQQQNEFWRIYNKLVKVGIIYASFGFIYAALKFSINLPRPFCSLPKDSFLTIANIAGERCLSSFPSAHTGLAILICYFLWSYLKLPHRLIGVMIVLLVGISRITLAMHYPADIIYSILIAGLVIMIGNILFKLFVNKLIKFIGELVYFRFFKKFTLID